jgi:hypothetical protein
MINLIFVLSTAAQAETAFEQAIAQHNQVQTREQWISVDGTPHRLIQIGEKNYLLKLNKNETKPTAELRCDLVDEPNPKDIEDALESGGRSKEFKEKVEKACAKTKGSVTIALDSSFVPLISEFDDGLVRKGQLRMGVTPGSKSPGMQVKKKF